MCEPQQLNLKVLFNLMFGVSKDIMAMCLILKVLYRRDECVIHHVWSACATVLRNVRTWNTA